MDGTFHIAIIGTGLIAPAGLALDFETQTLYIADAAQGSIARSNPDGTQFYRIYSLSNVGLYPTFMEYYSETFYIANSTTNLLYIIRETTSARHWQFNGGIGNIRVIDPLQKQPSENS